MNSLSETITKNFFDTNAVISHHDHRASYEQWSRNMLPRIAHWLPSDTSGRCIDLGCGCGEALFMLEQRGFSDLHGVDLCQKELDQAQSYLRSATLVCDNIVAYLAGQPAGSCQLVTAFNILEHLTKDDLYAVLRETSRVLAPGGKCIAVVPNAVSIFGGLTRHIDLTHEWAFTPNNFRQLAPLCGFDPAKTRFREWGPLPHGLTSTIRYALWQVIRAAIASYLMVEVANTKGGVYTMDMLVYLERPAMRNGSPE